ncbi:unnamed protein product [Cuscuta europaea]|uniref:CCHC-type domain-containing protein n=1 Tax=Cuscuta europaea TaxID=41803 RepID=A0A9P0ZLU1_CUSEU|nr:unnamed protein product [Cuscuta europaea]CAH9107532.1 unnamed protein product [Cuscuta europaea]
MDSDRNLRIVLRQERKEYVLDQPIPAEPAANAPRATRDAYERHVRDEVDVTCLMLTIMEANLQKQFLNRRAHDISNELKNLFQKQAQIERFETTKALFHTRLTDGSPVGPHVLKMIGYMDHLERLGSPISQELATDVILASLTPAYDQFILNYNMHGLEKTLTELHGMLNSAEQNIKKNWSDVLMIKKGKGFKKPGKGKVGGNKKSKTLVKNSGKGKSVASSTSKEEQKCFHCNKTGHWKRNCKAYLEELKRKGHGDASNSGTDKE